MSRENNMENSETKSWFVNTLTKLTSLYTDKENKREDWNYWSQELKRRYHITMDRTEIERIIRKAIKYCLSTK